eukprot:1968997-Ditylum_brightwellii.AAC.1
MPGGQKCFQTHHYGMPTPPLSWTHHYQLNDCRSQIILCKCLKEIIAMVNRYGIEYEEETQHFITTEQSSILLWYGVESEQENINANGAICM